MIFCEGHSLITLFSSSNGAGFVILMMSNKTLSTQPDFAEALKFWFKLGWISFGGTAGHIAIMHDFLVDKKKWISNGRFFHALSICMLLPGPEAQQLAIYIGNQLHGKKGGLAAGILFVLPSMFILLALSITYVTYGDQPWIKAMFNGLKPAVIGIIAIALFKVAQKSLNSVIHYVVAALAFVAIFFFNISMLFIITGTIVLAMVIRYCYPKLLSENHVNNDKAEIDETAYFINKYSGTGGETFNTRQFVMQLLAFFGIWLLPLAGVYFLAPDFSFWRRLILFFTEAAFFTIGGSYTVLPYVAQFAVKGFKWLSGSQMVDGFALAETTPGPLIIVVGFVGFMAGFGHFHNSVMLGSLALLLTVFYTFLPCFLYIFAGAPLIEKTHGSEAVSHVLQLVTAAVVGVILNLTMFLGRGVLFPHELAFAHLDMIALGLIIMSALLLHCFKLNIIYLIGLSLLIGLLRYKVGI